MMSKDAIRQTKPALAQEGRRRAWVLGVMLGVLVCAAPQLASAGQDTQAARYKQARTLLEQDAERAWAIAKDLGELPHADELRIKLMADAALMAGQVEQASRLYMRYADMTDSFADAYAARLAAAEALVLLGELDRADAILQGLEATQSRLRNRYAMRRHLRASVLRMRHDIAVGKSGGQPTARSRSWAKQLLVFFPDEPATRRGELSIKVDDLDSMARYARARNLYEAWAYADAREEFRRFLDDPARHLGAKWHLAQIALNKLRDDPKEAERYFGEVSESNSTNARTALYELSRSKMRQERYDEAIAVLDEYARRYPRGPHMELVYYYRAWLPYDHRDNIKAIDGFKTYIARYGKRGSKSTFIYGFLAWAYMREKRWQEAINTFEEMLTFGNPIVAGKALYWQAYAYEELGKREEAMGKLNALRRQYPVSYYGVLGEQLRARLEGKDARASQVWFPEGAGTYDDTPPYTLEQLDVSGHPAHVRAQWDKVKLLVAMDEPREARAAIRPIFDKLLSKVPASQRRDWLRTLSYAVQDYHRVWQIGAKGTISWLPPTPDPDPIRSTMAYPRAYASVVHDVAAEFKLPPYLIWAIMRQESRYKPEAISHTDAVGALQMIPQTARLVARDLGIEYNPRTFHYPEVGFRFSAYYMRKLLDLFGGMITPMASSYNTGPGPIARWFKKNPDASFPWLIEEFEYNEGRAYGRKVTEHMTRYVYLYEQDPAKRAALLDQLYPLSRDITLPDDVGY
jgi:soluble lytic murein transglycosylase